MFLFYCEKCNKLVSKKENNDSQMCSTCNTSLIPLNKSVDEWNVMTTEEMKALVNKACDDAKSKSKKQYKAPILSSGLKEGKQDDLLPKKANNKISDKTSADNTSAFTPVDNKTSTSNEKKDKPYKYLYYLATVFYLLAAAMLYKGIDKMVNYKNSEYTFGDHVNSYVGGDAYNYIINGTYSTSFFVLTAGFLIAGILLSGFGLLLNEGVGRGVEAQTSASSESKQPSKELPDL